MGRSGISSVEYAINPYLGCQHGCVYCYARFMSRMGHAGEEWGSFVDVKVNALERLTLEAKRKRKGIVLLSSVTDPYQPVERRFKLIRGSLEILLERQFPVEILTKSDLVLRDMDLLQQFDFCEVGFTITTANEEVRRVFEPGSSPVEARLTAMRELSNAGVATYAFLGPMLPYLSEKGLDGLLDELARCADRVMIDRLNIKSGNLPSIRRAMSANYLELKPMFERALSPESGYYNMLKRKVSDMCHQRGIPCGVIY
jgi:DNA repair photolyase